jgi:tetratricopeptide (TPR) repeat protein
MKKLFTIALSIVFVCLQTGCGANSDNTNNNNSTATPTATPAVANQSNSNTSAKQSEPVPTFSDAPSAYTAGNKYFDADETEKAIEAYKQAVALDPDLAEAHFKLGVAYALIEKVKETEVLTGTSTEPTPAKPAKKGAETVKKKDSEKAFAEAVKAYKKLTAKNAKDDLAFFNLGRSYNKLNDDKEAEKALRQAAKLKPDDSEYQTELGEILFKLAKYDEALGVAKKALSLDENNSQAADLLEKAQAGKKRIEFGLPKDRPAADRREPDSTKTKPKTEEPKPEPTPEKKLSKTGN